ncbi:MAG: sodium:alanine symporter family protein [Clostridia bacterium]|nr:sodium:alanine symporter family protein [Clostridia bacterium]
MIYLLVTVHLFLTIRLKGVQRHIFKGIKYSFTSGGNTDGIGTYRAFAAALGTTIGPGNITGVAVAISTGGAGAVFWMWFSGLLSMSTKYAESYLALKYRKKSGGTMTLLSMLGHPFLASFWAIMCGVGGLFMGAAVPSNSLARSFDVPAWTIGAILSFFVVLTISFGFKGIANVSAFAVPVMSLGFTLFCLFVTVKNIDAFPTVICDMLKGAFLPSSVAGGAFATALKEGVKRGLYSNESGLGTGGVLAAESGDENVELSSLAAMSTTFWDTVVMCAVTGIMFLSCGAKRGMSVAEIIELSFGNGIFNKIFFAVSMSVFVYATVIGWYYIGRRAIETVIGNKAVFDVLYTAFVFFGAVMSVNSVWSIADAVNICLLLPSIYAILRLSKKIVLYRKDN